MRYKPKDVPYSHVYIGPNADIGTLRSAALNKVGAGAEPGTFNQLKELISNMNALELRKRMSDLDQHGDFDMSPVPPEPKAVW